MRVFAFSLLFSVSLFAQNSTSSDFFPIPKGLDKVWPNAVLSDKEESLLRKAVEPDLRALERENDCTQETSTFDSVDKTRLPLGKLGNGIFVATNSSCVCAKAGCPVYLYLPEKYRYRGVLSGDGEVAVGWAFALVDSRSGIPDLVLASNPGHGVVVLTKYRYLGGKFVSHACEKLVAKNWPDSPNSWWIASEVNIQPCEGR